MITNNKKIAIQLILFSLLVLLISYLIKEPNDYTLWGYYQSHNFDVPLSTYSVYILGFSFSLKTLVLSSTLLLCIGIYLLLYKTDTEIKQYIKVAWKRFKNIFQQKKKVKSETTNNLSQSDKASIGKDTAAIIGWIFLWITIILRATHGGITEDFGSQELQIYYIVLGVLSISYRLFASWLCVKLLKYNIGSKGSWETFGIILPSLALIYAGMKRTLKPEFK